MSTPQLRSLVRTNHLAHSVFEILAKRQREPRNGIMELRRLRYDLEKAGIKVIDEDFEEIFTELEEIGMGKIVKEKGKPPEFHWKKSIKEVSGTALAQAPKTKQSSKANASGSHIEVTAMLSSERTASFNVPDDLTPGEIDYLINLLKVRRVQ